jgi:hypothetical protein
LFQLSQQVRFHLIRHWAGLNERDQFGAAFIVKLDRVPTCIGRIRRAGAFRARHRRGWFGTRNFDPNTCPQQRRPLGDDLTTVQIGGRNQNVITLTP